MIDQEVTLSTNAVSWHDHYWNSLLRELEERELIDENEVVKSFDLHVEVETGVTISNIETETVESSYGE